MKAASVLQQHFYFSPLYEKQKKGKMKTGQQKQMKDYHQESPKGDFQILGKILHVFLWKQVLFCVIFENIMFSK